MSFGERQAQGGRLRERSYAFGLLSRLGCHGSRSRSDCLWIAEVSGIYNVEI
jgi:hypothetical protein